MVSPGWLLPLVGLLLLGAGEASWAPVLAVEGGFPPDALVLGRPLSSTLSLEGLEHARLRGEPVPLEILSPGDRVSFLPGGREVAVDLTLDRGALVDIRYGELLLESGLNLRLAGDVRILLNGQAARADDLPRGRTALVRWDRQTGRIGHLEVVDPARERPRAPGPGDLWAVKAGLTPGARAPDRPLRAGETLHVELRAPPHGTAFFDVAGLAWYLPTREVRPGVYRGRLRVVPGMDVRDTYVLGRYYREGREYPVRVGPKVSLAPSPPRVEAYGPRDPAFPDSPVFAVLSSRGARVEGSATRLWVDGEERTRRARRTHRLVYYRPSGLDPGVHRVRITFRDTAGNPGEWEWEFRVGGE